jgi:DNA-binding response OmpR family regulator
MPHRVIIVEDHAESAEGLAELMSIWGYEPHIAADGERALELLDTVDPHIVISDIGLPGMDGHELARRIRSAVGGGGILLVALTGVADDETLADSNFDHTLVKPVQLDVLERLLETETNGNIRRRTQHAYSRL